ncbi:hypothetical protein Tco_1542025 [Tanacetum coccineum]
MKFFRGRKRVRRSESYGYQSQYDHYDHDTYSADYNIGIEDYTICQGTYDDQYCYPSYESSSFFNQPQRPSQEYCHQVQKQGDNQHLSFDEKYDKLMSMIESYKEENQRALETQVGRLAEQLNREETYKPQGITMLDFDDEDKGEEQNEEFTLHSTNTTEWSAFGSYKDKEDEHDHNNSLHDPILPVKEHLEELVPPKAAGGVMETNTTPYL